MAVDCKCSAFDPAPYFEHAYSDKLLELLLKRDRTREKLPTYRARLPGCAHSFEGSEDEGCAGYHGSGPPSGPPAIRRAGSP